MVTYPEDWKEVLIGDIYQIKRGQVLATSKISPIKNATNKFPVYSSQTLKNGLLGYFNQYLFSDGITWTTDGANAGTTKYREGKFYCTNVCGVLSSQVGYANICMAEIINIETPKYVSYVGNPKLMSNVVSKISIILPPLQEQQAISSVLSDFDEHIDNLTMLIEKKKAIRDGALEDLVSGRTRLEGFGGEWNNVKLSDFAQINPPSSLPDIFKYVDLESVKGISLESWRVERRETAPSRAKRLAQQGDIFFQTVRPYQRNNYLFDLPDEDFVFSTGYAQLRTENNARFLFLLLRQDAFVNEVLDNCTGTSYPAINPSRLADINIYVPVDICEQQAIADILSSMDEEIEALELEKAKMIQIREGAMDDLLTGRVRLKV